MTKPKRLYLVRRPSLTLVCVAAVSPFAHVSCVSETDNDSDQHPNIIIILADDMGYGDVSSLNSYSRIETPALDGMVKEGISFSRAHASASVCTPSRYGILTGRYAQRSSTGANRGQMGFHPSVIEPGRETIASLLQKNGYSTACIGKWHLGLDWQTTDGSEVAAMDPLSRYSNVDYSQEVKRGPNDYGFDYSFIHPASLDIPPYMFVRNHQVVDPDVILTTDHYPTRKDYTEYAWDRIHTDDRAVYWEKGVWWREGEMSRSFRIEDCQEEIVREGIRFIDNHVAENPGTPFFLYLPLTGPHTPWVPIERFKGKSPIGLYGDFVMEIDDVVRRIQQALIDNQVDENTWLIFASDNGGYWPQEEIDLHQHDSNWGRTGQKGDVWDGGHRIPLIMTWPARIHKSFASDQLVSLTDLFATISNMVGTDLSDDMGEDSFSFYDVINGEKNRFVRHSMTHYSSRRIYGIRHGEWKYIEGLGSGGFTHPAIEEAYPGGPVGQLYRLPDDSLETDNLYLKNPDELRRMQEMLHQAKMKGERLMAK